MTDLPGEVQLAIADVASVARARLLAMSAAVGMAVTQAMFAVEVAAVCGPKGEHASDRAAVHPETGSVRLGGRRVHVEHPRTPIPGGGRRVR
jgi:hypothetical protein